jgi:Pentapeptide repeats (8 copies)
MGRKARHRAAVPAIRSQPEDGDRDLIILPVRIIERQPSPAAHDRQLQRLAILVNLLLAITTLLGPIIAARFIRPQESSSGPPADTKITVEAPPLALASSTLRDLADPNVGVRESAILDVGRVARLSPDAKQRHRLLEELSAYVRRRSPQLPGPGVSAYCRQLNPVRYPSDVQLALDQLGRRHFEDRHERVDLYGVNLAYTNLSRRDLRSFVFDKALLCRSDLSNVMLQDTSFRGANLSHAWMAGTYATNQQLLDADNLFGLVLPWLPRKDPAVLYRVARDPNPPW